MIGVSRLAWELDDFPYIATGIALTWGTYSMLKKRIGLRVFQLGHGDDNIGSIRGCAFLVWKAGRIGLGNLGVSLRRSDSFYWDCDHDSAIALQLRRETGIFDDNGPIAIHHAEHGY